MGFNRYSVFQCTVLSHVNRCTYIHTYVQYIRTCVQYIRTYNVCMYCTVHGGMGSKSGGGQWCTGLRESFFAALSPFTLRTKGIFSEDRIPAKFRKIGML